MNLTKLSIKRPVAVFISILALFVFGAGSLFSTPMELIPSMTMPMMLVLTVYPGAGPEEVESLVSSKVEGAVSTLSGLKNVQSVSSENMSVILLELEYGTNSDRARTDLQKNLDLIQNSLPDTVQDPTIIEMSTDSMPVVMLAAEATGDIDLLNFVNDNVVPEFEKIDGVAQVSISGGQETYIQVKLIPERLRQYKLDMATVSSYVKAADFSIPIGSADQGDVSLGVRGGVSYNTVEALRDIPLTLPTGDILHLSDIADVSYAQKEASSISRYNGQDTVSINITKRDSAGTTGVCDDVIKAMKSINAANTNLQLEVIMDTSDDIRGSLSGVAQSMVLAIVISMVVLYFFLGDIKASFVVGTSMPISVLTTLIIMSFSGMSFNMLSLGGLTIGVGMMVDNSIVVLDSCFTERARLNRRTFREAALEGARIVTSAVVASTLTTVVVFLPICLMEGMSGQMFSDVGLTIVYALTASLISAIMLVPLLFVRMKPVERKGIPANRFLIRLGNGYERVLRGSFKHRIIVVLFSFLLLIGSITLVPLIGAELIPATDAGQITISIQTKPGLQLEKVDTILRQVEELVVAQPEFDRYTSSSGGDGVFGSSEASVTMYLKEDHQTPTADVADTIRAATKNMVDCKVTVQSVSGMSMSGGGSDSLSFMLTGRDSDQLAVAASNIQGVLREQEGVINTSSSLSDGNPQLEVLLDPVKAGAAGLVPAQAVQSLNMVLSGTMATTIQFGGQDYEIRVEYPEDTYPSVKDVKNIMLDTPGGRQVTLSDIAQFELSNSPQQIMRYNSQYMVEVSAQLQPQIASKISSSISETISAVPLPGGVTFFSGGQQEQMVEEFSSLLGALATAIFLVFMVMAIQFESIRFSLMVMISMPFSLIGAFLGLLLTNTTISMPSLLGVIMLAGIVVNNAIVLIDYANQLRAGGMEVHEALVSAGRSRLRPILMTTLTTVLGMVPLAIGFGNNAEMMRGMAMVIIGGLSTSTLLTLVLIPTFYLMITKKERHKADREKRDEDENEVLIDRAEFTGTNWSKGGPELED